MDFESKVRIILHCTCIPTGEDTPWNVANTITQKVKTFLSGEDPKSTYEPKFVPDGPNSGNLQVVVNIPITAVSYVDTLITKFRNNVDALGPYSSGPSFRFIDQGVL